MTYSKLDLPTKFHPNQNKIAKVCYSGGFWMGGWGGLNVPLAMPYADILLLIVNLNSPPSFIQIGPKLPKFDIWGGSWVGRVVGRLNIPPSILQAHILLFNINETPPSFIQIDVC